MARSHARILTQIWEDQDFVALPGHAQRCYFLLLSQPDLGHAGILPTTVRRWTLLSSDETEAGLRASLAVLADTTFVVVDDRTEELLIRSLIRNDGVWKQPKVLAVAINEAAHARSPVIRACVATELARIDPAELPDKTRPDVEDLLKNLPSRLVTALAEVAGHQAADPPDNPVREAPADPPADPPPHPPANGVRVRAGASPTPAPAPSPSNSAASRSAQSAVRGPASDSDATAQTLIGEWIDNCRERPPGRVIGHVSKELKLLLDEGIPYDKVRRGLADWHRAGQNPSTLASFVNAAMNASPGGGRSQRPSSQDVADKLDALKDPEPGHPTIPGVVLQ